MSEILNLPDCDSSPVADRPQKPPAVEAVRRPDETDSHSEEPVTETDRKFRFEELSHFRAWLPVFESFRDLGFGLSHYQQLINDGFDILHRLERIDSIWTQIKSDLADFMHLLHSYSDPDSAGWDRVSRPHQTISMADPAESQAQRLALLYRAIRDCRWPRRWPSDPRIREDDCYWAVFLHLTGQIDSDARLKFVCDNFPGFLTKSKQFGSLKI